MYIEKNMSKHIVDCTKEGMTYKDIPEMSRYNVAISTQVHNHIVYKQRSKRNKLRICDCDAKNRKDEVIDRLKKKLEARKKKKSS